MIIKELNTQDYLELATMTAIMVFLKNEGQDRAAQLVGEEALNIYGEQALAEMLDEHLNS